MELTILLVSLLGDAALAYLMCQLYRKAEKARPAPPVPGPAKAEAPPAPLPAASSQPSSRHIGEIMTFGTEKYVLLRALAAGTVQDREQLREALAVTNLFGGQDGPCAVIEFRQKNGAGAALGQSRQDMTAWNALLASAAEAEIGCRCPCETVYGTGGDAMVVVYGSLEQRETQEFLILACQRILEKMQAELQMVFSCGIGICVESLFDLPGSLTSARLAGEYRLFFGEQAVIRYQDIEYRNSVPYHYPDQEEENILKCMKQLNGLRAEEEIRAFFKAIEMANVRSVQLCIHNLVVVICRFIKMSGEAEGDQLDYHHVIERVEHMETMYEMMQEINDLVQAYVTAASQKRYERNNGTLEEIVQFMENNYQNPSFSILDLEEHLHYSGNHIRNLFKEAYQLTPMEYLLRLRMEKAKELLASTDMKAAAIAESVGYENPKYFYSLFKKHTGMTTYEYRTGIRTGQLPDSEKAKEGTV